MSVIIERENKARCCKECRYFLCWGECSRTGISGDKDTIYMHCPVVQLPENTNAIAIKKMLKEREEEQNG